MNWSSDGGLRASPAIEVTPNSQHQPRPRQAANLRMQIDDWLGVGCMQWLGDTSTLIFYDTLFGA
jgi:hypothetical protein